MFASWQSHFPRSEEHTSELQSQSNLVCRLLLEKNRELVARYPDKFTTNYESNKTVLADLVDAKTKRLRNRVVGYVTRLKIVEIRRSSAPTSISEESDRE